MKKLRITADDIFLYLKDGTAVNSHREIGSSEVTLFADNCRTFSGLDRIYISQPNLASLK